MKTEFRFIEGLKGSGVVVSMTYDNYRLIFDFGAPFRPDTNIYDGVVKHRHQNALLDALRLKETPEIDGIYPRKDLVLYDGSIYKNIQPFEESNIQSAVLISHLHLDHMSNIQYLEDSIPVYMHHNGKKLLNVLEDINEGTPHENVLGVEYLESFKHGPFVITPHFNDHPCYGSTSYMIDCPDGKVLYTGDIRFHGISKEKAFEEIEIMGKEDIDLLIVDGTSFSPSKFIHNPEKIKELSEPSKDILEGMFLEEKIYEDVAKRLETSSDLGFFCIYHRDMQLIESLTKHVGSVNRKIAYEVETAYVINKVMNEKVHFYVSDNEVDENILNYVREHNTEVTFDEINTHKNEYLVQVSYKNIMNLFSFDTKGGVYFHLFGDPFGKENRQCKILQTMLEMNQIDYVGYSNVYSFNHAFPNHLSYAIGTLHPKNVVCVHSNCPEKLNPMGSNHVLPDQYEPYILENNVLVKSS